MMPRLHPAIRSIALLATLEEASQAFIAARSCSWGDLTADLLGILLAGLVLAAFLRRRTRGARGSGPCDPGTCSPRAF